MRNTFSNAGTTNIPRRDEILEFLFFFTEEWYTLNNILIIYYTSIQHVILSCYYLVKYSNLCVESFIRDSWF